MAAVDSQRVDRLAHPARRGPTSCSRSRSGRSASPRPGKSNATARSPCSASAGITFRYRNELVGTPCRSTTAEPPPSPCSRTKLRTPPASKRRPAAWWTVDRLACRLAELASWAIGACSAIDAWHARVGGAAQRRAARLARVGSFNPVQRGQEGARWSNADRQGRPRPRRSAPHAGADRARDRREEPRVRRRRAGRHPHPRGGARRAAARAGRRAERRRGAVRRPRHLLLPRRRGRP